MSEATQQLIASALQLSPQERAVVANAILASLEGPTDNVPPEIRDAWAAEIGRRVEDLDSGRVKAVPSSEAWKMIDGETEIPD
jgi:putative addiction module component (TIGR02574 family)